MIGLIVPVLHNFEGFTRLMESVDLPVMPYVIDNYEINRGVAAAWNEGLRSAMNCEYAFIVNDDVTMYRDSMSKMIGDMQLHNADLVSAIGGDGLTGGFHEIVDNGSPDFSCFVVKPKQFVEKFGFFDEKFYPAYFEDNDMRYRIKLAGGKQGVSLGARMKHGVSVTQNWNGERVVSHEQFDKNKAYYVSKWGGEPGKETVTEPFGAEWKEI